MVPDPETLAEIETHRRELKATYDAITSVLRVVEDLQTRAGVELRRWDRKAERVRQETAIEEQRRLEVLRCERDTGYEPAHIYEPAGGWSR